MEYKEAETILLNLLKKETLTVEEKEALLTAIGVLDMASLTKSRIKSLIKARKTKRDKSTEW